MPKIDVTKTELVWPGKYSEDGTLKEVPRVNLPFQVIETVNESRPTREAKKGGVQASLLCFCTVLPMTSPVRVSRAANNETPAWREHPAWGVQIPVLQVRKTPPASAFQRMQREPKATA